MVLEYPLAAGHGLATFGQPMPMELRGMGFCIHLVIDLELDRRLDTEVAGTHDLSQY